MAQMAVSEGGRFEFPYTITSALDNTNVGTLQTTNKFLDKDIDIKLTLASAAATITASKTATSPTIARTDTSATGATNVGSSSATTTAPSSGYFIATQATAPATTLDITKTVNTPGYLGANTQISASAATTAKSGSIYYIPITTGVAAANASAASITIETTDDSSKAGVNVQSILGTAADSEPTSGYFLRIKADGSGSSKVTTAGWFPTGALATSSTSTTKFYPVTAAAATVSGTTAANKPTITRTDTTATGATNIGSSAASTSAPSSGYFIATRANAPATTVSLTKTVGTSGYLGANTQISASASTSARDGDVYYIPITTGVATTDGADVALFTTDGTNNGVNISAIVGTKATSEPTSGYYLAFKGSGNSKVSTAGWFPTGSLSTTTSDAKYFPITAAVGTVTGTNTVTPSASLSSSNVTLSDTNNGISVTATGGGTASVTASANITTAGYAPSGTGFASATLAASSNTTTATKYISAITIPASKSLTITNNGTANVTNTGTTTITSNSTSAGTVTVVAKKASTDSSNTTGTVIENGLWKLATVTTSSTNDGMSTYFTTGSSSDKNVTIIPKYTNTAGYKEAVSTATSGGGTTYWKIKTATPAFDGGTLSGGSTATGTNVTLSSTDNGIKIQTAYTAASTAVLYNGAVEGWVSKANDAEALAAKSKSSTNGTAYYITAVTVPKDKTFGVTMTADTELDTTSDLDVTNAAYRRIDITNAANGTVLVANSGNTTVTSGSATEGNLTVSAYNASGTAENNKSIVSGGKWVATSVSATGTYYGRVTVRAISGSIGGSAASGSATAVITNTNSVNTITDLTNKTAGTDYWQIKATATGAAGSYTPKYTVSTSGWLASTVNGTAQTVSVSSDTTGKSIYIPKATFTVSGRNVTVNTAGYIASGTVGTISNGTISAVASDPGSSYSENTTAVIAAGGWLKLTAGYYPATKISLATLIKDDASLPNGVASYSAGMLLGVTAYDNNGTLVTGNIATYQGDYTYTT